MKQNIDLEQLEELSPEGLKRLQEWYQKHKEDKFGVPILSIGRMIEFLGDHKEYVKCDQWIKDEYHHWRVGINWFNEDEYDYIVEKPDLCDALWEAVKEVLAVE